MIKRAIAIGFFLIVLQFVYKANAQELWFEYGASYKTWRNLTTKVELQNRFVDRGQFYNYKNCIELTLQYRLSPVLKLSGSYRIARQHNFAYQIDQEGEVGKQRYCIDMNMKLPFNNDKYSIENRSRYQISLKNNEDARKFYRNKTTFGIEIDKKTDALFADEVYYYITKHRLDMNRVSLGIEREITKKISFNVLFHIETDKEGRSLSNNYIINTGLFLKL